MDGTIERESVRSYLDAAITHWRARRDEAMTSDGHHEADCYVDAFQSVRMSLLGEVLPGEG